MHSDALLPCASCKLLMAGESIRFPSHHLEDQEWYDIWWYFFGPLLCWMLLMYQYYVIQILERTFWTYQSGIKTKNVSSVSGSKQILDPESTEKEKGQIWAQYYVEIRRVDMCLFLRFVCVDVFLSSDVYLQMLHWLGGPMNGVEAWPAWAGRCIYDYIYIYVWV